MNTPWDSCVITFTVELKEPNKLLYEELPLPKGWKLLDVDDTPVYRYHRDFDNPKVVYKVLFIVVGTTPKIDDAETVRTLLDRVEKCQN